MVVSRLEFGGPELVREGALAQDLDEGDEHVLVGEVEDHVLDGREEALGELLVDPASENLKKSYSCQTRGTELTRRCKLLCVSCPAVGFRDVMAPAGW